MYLLTYYLLGHGDALFRRGVRWLSPLRATARGNRTLLAARRGPSDGNPGMAAGLDARSTLSASPPSPRALRQI